MVLNPQQRMILDCVDILKQLVAIPSVNPMGREMTDPMVGEARLTDYLEKLFTRMGLATHRQPVAPGRENLIARLDGDIPPAQGGRVILLDAHQDTVPTDGMTINPFLPRQRDGKLYGRGACDVKGGMAAIVAAVSRLAHEKPKPRPTIIVSCTVNEEYGFSGAMRLTKLWGDACGDIIPRKPDAAIVVEPTGLNVVVAHKGVIRWKCHTRGQAAHSACPEAGDNAEASRQLEQAQAAIDRTDHLAREVAQQMIPYANNIPTEKYLLFRYNQNVIRWIENAREEIAKTLAAHKAPAR